MPSDEHRKPRGRRYDQLPRKTAEPQHEARARARCEIKVTDCTHDDAGPFGCGFYLDVGRALAQIGDEMHALIGHRDLEPIDGTPRQDLHERVALLAILLAHTTNMRCEMALLHELANDRLLQRRRLAIHEIARAYKSLQPRARHYGVADT